MTTSSVRPVLVCATTLRVERLSARVSRTSVAGVPARANSGSPSVFESPAAGIRDSATDPIVPFSGPGSVFTTMIAAAPASAASACFCVNGHTPRRATTIAPRASGPKSVASQAGVASAGVSGRTTRGAVTPPGGVGLE